MSALTVLLVGSLTPPDEKDFLTPGHGRSSADATEAERAAAKTRFKEATKAYDAHRPRFEAACKALGAAFARRHWRIMVGVPLSKQWTERQTVAPFVLDGANSAKPKADRPEEAKGPYPILFYSPREPEPQEPAQQGPAGMLQQIAAGHSNLTLEYKWVAQGQYKAKVIPNVAEVNAVVLVAGKEGTATIGYAAYSLERPVLAVAGFGGAARSLLDDVLFDVYDRYKESVHLTDGELLSLTADWKDKADHSENQRNAEHVVSAAEKLVKAYALADKETASVLKWATKGMALLLVLWVAIFLAGATVALEVKPGPAPNAPTASPVPLGPSTVDSKRAAPAKHDDTTAKAAAEDAQPFHPDIRIALVKAAFFLLLFTSAAVGTGLRVLTAFQTSQLTRLTGLAVWVEIVVALSVAFGLALFYLVGSISFTGHVSMLESDAENLKNFPMIGVSMSLLGLAAGYLLPLDKLRDRLQKIFAEEKKKK